MDVGTGGTRGVLVDEAGIILASATEEHEAFVSLKIGWAEQHPDDWWRAAGIAIRKATAQSQIRPEQIAAIGFSCQMHCPVIPDGSGRAIRPPPTSFDVPTEKQC